MNSQKALEGPYFSINIYLQMELYDEYYSQAI